MSQRKMSNKRNLMTVIWYSVLNFKTCTDTKQDNNKKLLKNPHFDQSKIFH